MNSQLNIIVAAQDRTTAVMANIERSTKRLANTFDSFKGRLNNAFQYHVIYRSLNLLGRGLNAISDAIPNLIHRGEAWAKTVDAISDSTGLSAQKASELAAVQSIVGDGTDSLSRAFVIFAKNAVQNREAFDQMGIATRGANGEMLDAYTIFQNARERISATGASLLSTNAATKVFGRGAHDLLDLLSLTNGQWRIYAEEARRSGLILTESGLMAAEQWQRTQKMLDNAITGIGAQVLQGAAPALISLANGITRALQDNMDNIVRFVVQAVNFVAGLIGGFLGIDLGMVTIGERISQAGNDAERASGKVDKLTTANLTGEKAAKRAASGQDAYSKSLQRSIDAIDRQLSALDRSERRASSKATQQGLLRDISEARAELADIRSDTIFASGISEAEAELARQAQAARVVDGQTKVRDAEKRLRDERRSQEVQARRDELNARRDHLQRMLSQHQQAMSRIGNLTTGAARGVNTGLVKPISKLTDSGLPKLSEGLRKAAEDAQATGREISGSIMDLFLGTAKPVLNQLGVAGGTKRSGGLFDTFRDLAKSAMDLARTLSGAVGGISQASTLIGGVIATILGWKVLNALPGAGAIGGLGRRGPGRVARGDVPLGGVLGPAAVATAASLAANAAIKALVPATGGSNRINAGANANGTGGTIFSDGSALLAGVVGEGIRGVLNAVSDTINGTGGAGPGFGGGRRNGPITGADGMRNPRYRAWWESLQLGGDGSSLNPPEEAGPQSSRGIISGGKGRRGMGRRTSAEDDMPLPAIFRKYLGADSPLGRGQSQVVDATSTGTVFAATTSDNTAPLGAGQMGVNINAWAAGRLATNVADWAAGRLPTSVDNNVDVSNGNFGNIGDIDSIRSGNVFRVDNASGTYLGMWPTGGKALPTNVKNKLLVQNAISQVWWATWRADQLQTLHAIRDNTRGRASGGYSAANTPVLVGENGPEWATAGRGGMTIHPGARVSRHGGGGPMTIQITNVMDRNAVRQMMSTGRSSTTLKPVS